MALQLGLGTAAVLSLAIVAWLAIVALSLAMATVARRADSRRSEAWQELQTLQQLADVRSPSGKPFFRTARHGRVLLQSIAELRAALSVGGSRVLGGRPDLPSRL